MFQQVSAYFGGLTVEVTSNPVPWIFAAIAVAVVGVLFGRSILTELGRYWAISGEALKGNLADLADEFAPVLRTRTGKNATAQYLTTALASVGLVIPDERVQTFVAMLAVVAGVWYWLRTLNGRKGAKGPLMTSRDVDTAITGAGPMGPGAALGFAAVDRVNPWERTVPHARAENPRIYALAEDGYQRCCNCETIKGDPHSLHCTGGSLLVSGESASSRAAKKRMTVEEVVLRMPEHAPAELARTLRTLPPRQPAKVAARKTRTPTTARKSAKKPAAKKKTAVRKAATTRKRR